MKVSFNWLKDFIDIDLSVMEVADELTRLGLEVEAIEYPDDFSNVVVGLVESCVPLPDGKNKYCLVNVGRHKVKVVCGAPNVEAGLLVPIVLPGGRLPDVGEIKPVSIGGRESQGMICSQHELMLGGEADRIWELDKDVYREIPGIPGTDLRKKFPADFVYKLEITHNRPDCLSHFGVARDLAAGLNLSVQHTPYDLRESGKPVDYELSVGISAPDKCPRYCGRVITGVKVGSSPRWMQRRLLAVGLRPINNIVDVTNYVMMEYGHPLHGFDFDLIAEKRIEVKTAADGEKFVTLDEKEQQLDRNDLLICDGEKAVALAGVMGGLNSEIKDDSQDILIECAYFHPVSIRHTAKRLGISTDSSYRFERGVDPNAVPLVIDRAARLMHETGGGEILFGRVDNYAMRINPRKVNLRPARVNFVLGTNLRRDVTAGYLKRLQFGVKRRDKLFSVEVPSFRPDILEEIDLIEEIARINSYYKVKSANRGNFALNIEPLPEEDFDNKIRLALVEAGMYEVLTHSMRHIDRAGLGQIKPAKIANPLSADFALMRSDLISPLMEVASYNLNHGAESVRIFELGHVFAAGKKNKWDETKQIAVFCAGKAETSHWSTKETSFDFFRMKGVVENFLDRLSIEDYVFSTYLGGEDYFENARSVLVLGNQIGAFGELKMAVCEQYDIETPAFIFLFDYDALFSSHLSDKKFSDYSRKPVVKRDLSIIFADDISAHDIEKAILEVGGEFLTNIHFFDLYRSKQIGQGRKSVSISLQFQAEDRTLRDDEVDITINDIMEVLKKTGGEIRAR